MTTGKDACPPEDCGGVWGYQDLRDALADPAHERHEEMLEWLGLQTAAEFDPARFDPEEVNMALGAGEDAKDGRCTAPGRTNEQWPSGGRRRRASVRSGLSVSERRSAAGSGKKRSEALLTGIAAGAP